MEQAEPVFQAIALAVLADENIIVCCKNDSQASEIKRFLTLESARQGGNGVVHTVAVPTNDTWARDFGPLTLTNGTHHRLVDARFNAWGVKFDSALDDQVNRHLHSGGLFGDLPLDPLDLVVEGGALETDGRGTLLATRHCLLNPNRNGDVSTPWMETRLRTHLGIDRFLWLDHGALEGDDTDGHIDTLARFCSDEHIVYQGCDQPADSHYSELQAMAQELSELERRDGTAYRLTELPWPAPLHTPEGRRLPATYANFLVTNQAVLVPIYGVPQDNEACETLGACFPGRQVRPVHCRPLLAQGGSLHCLTMQLPPGVGHHE
jgi:agmatine deiminase